MRIVSKRRLRDFWVLHPEAESALRTWYKVVNEAAWPNFAELRQTFPSADQVGRLVVFNVSGNRYRLVVLVDYQWQKIFVRGVMPHAEYSKGDWKDDPWF